MKEIFAASLLFAFVSPALAAGGLPDGTYDCYMDGYGNGSIVIKGDTYQGPAYDGQYDGVFKYDVASGGNITWHGTLGLYGDPGIEHIGSLVVRGDRDLPAIEIHVRLQGSDNIHIAVCNIE